MASDGDGSSKKNLLLFCLLLLFVVGSAEPVEHLKASVASLPARRLLSSSSSQSMNRQGVGFPSPCRFEDRKHEVPSGANPVSN